MLIRIGTGCRILGIWNLELGIGSLKFGVWSLEFGVWNICEKQVS
jgi:hypothetical protein